MDLLPFHLPQTAKTACVYSVLDVCVMTEFELNAINARNSDAQKAE